MSNQATAPAILVERLHKQFTGPSGTVHALKGVSFEVARGQVFTILGPNGAGKTTLLRILTSVMRPQSGSAWVEGYELGRENMAIRPLIGIVSQDNHFDRYLTVWQNLDMHARMHGLDRKESAKRISELLERVHLYDRRKDYMETFSGGMQRRVALIRALIHRPRILFLDEPTTGLDPVARREIWNTIQELKQNTTVILTTHYMEEADRLSDRILMLNQGQVVMEGTPVELKRHISPPDIYELYLNRPVAEAYRQTLLHLLEEATVSDPYTLKFKLRRAEDLSVLIGQISPTDLRALGLAEADLEAVYLTVAGRYSEGGPSA
ncbi:MAG TPA: ABC transporter ATP-binding protein [Oculatellaceae cyanobacterium]|jgi:ABC-2 type transport system ATP-binding protein